MKEVQKVVVGKERAIAGVMCAMLAGGHILLEDIPGVGKTTMALAFAPAAFRVQPLVLRNPHVISKSYPRYWDDLSQAGFICTPL